MQSISLYGIEFANITELQCVQHIMCELKAERGGWVMTPNLDILRMIVKQPDVRQLASEVDLLVADGMPLIWAGRLQGTPLPERVCGSNLIYSVSEAAAANGRSVFLFGGAPGTADAAARILRERIPSLRIAGTLCPNFGFELDEHEMQKLTDILVESAPDVVFVALGCPKQEKIIRQIRHLLPSAWWLGIGISFSYVCGDVKRAPRWIQALGLEWTYRLIQEPRRMFSRYILNDAPFAIQLLCRSACLRLCRKLGKSAQPHCE